MKSLIVSILKFIIDKVKRNKFIQNVFESPFDLNKFEKMGSFKDGTGFQHQLYGGLRTKIKPGWERMVSGKKKLASDVNLDKLKTNSYIHVEKLETSLNTFGKSIQGSAVLEVGCHAGATCFAMAEKGAESVTGTEFNGYKVQAVAKEEAADTGKLNEVDEYLKSLRERVGGVYHTTEKVAFVNDDICNTVLTPNSFDIICSWEVLEHLHDPAKAFSVIEKLLKPGGISIHLYNPFFSINGGHSMCTLDFLWGHARLSDDDFSTYVKSNRPEEVEKAISFFKHGVNRMTLADLKGILDDSDMNILGLIPYTKEQHMRMVTKETLEQCQAHYPNLQLLDLAAPAVLVVTQKAK